MVNPDLSFPFLSVQHTPGPAWVDTSWVKEWLTHKGPSRASCALSPWEFHFELSSPLSFFLDSICPSTAPPQPSPSLLITSMEPDMFSFFLPEGLNAVMRNVFSYCFRKPSRGGPGEGGRSWIRGSNSSCAKGTTRIRGICALTAHPPPVLTLPLLGR